MKNLKLLFILVAISVTSISCGNDDDNDNQNPTANFLKFGGTEYELKTGTIEDYGLYSEGIYNFNIVLISSEINTVDGDPVPTDATFSGVYFELFTDNAENLEVGTYNFGNTIEVGSYIYADIIINGSADDEIEIEVNSGTFTILSNGSTYEIEFEGTSDDGTAFTGYYKGALIAIDYSSDDDGLDRLSNSKKTRKLLK